MTYHMKFQGLQQKLSLGVLKMIYDDENLQPCRLGVFWDGTFIEKNHLSFCAGATGKPARWVTSDTIKSHESHSLRGKKQEV